MSIGNKIRKRRKELGLTQTELGRRVHKSSQVISNWERGYTASITAENLQSLAVALDTNVQFFVQQGPLDFMSSLESGYARESRADSRLGFLIESYPGLDEKTKEIIEAIVKLSNNKAESKA